MDGTQLQIELQGGPGGPTTLPAKGMLVLGSSAERSGLVVDGQGVEDAHCAIGRASDGSWAIKDLGSRYGTFVNGTKVGSTRLSAGDVIVLGSRSLRLIDPSADTAARAPESQEASVRELAPSREEKLGGFRIERRLGRGGMGEVLLAVQESLNRPVALKLLSPSLAADRDFVLRFHSEARAAAALSHPNVVVVHDVGQEEGRHFLVMEYMPGGNLEERVARAGKLPWREVLRVLHDACAGLAFAESKGILHRDIKPANLMVAASGAVKIADLGLATPVGDQGGERTYGTPHFVSPEQARGQAVDHRSDLYSLGATAYRLLTGRTPFEGATASEIVRARFTQEPVPPSRHVPGIPPALEALVLQLMQRDPKRRPASAANLLRDVDRLRLEAEHGAPKRPPVVVARRRSSRAPLFVGLTALGGLVAAAVFLFGLGRDAGPDAGTARATLPGDDAEPTAASTRGDAPTGDAEFFGNGADGGPVEVDEEESLRVLELEARLAYADLPQNLTPEERVSELESLVERFGATTVATEARAEIADLRAGVSTSEALALRGAREVTDALARVRATAGWPLAGPAAQKVPKAWDHVQRVLAHQVTTAMVANPEFLAQRAELIEEILRVTAERARTVLADVDTRTASGDFAGARTALVELEPRLFVPDEKADEPAGYAALRVLGDDARSRLRSLGAEEQAYEERLARVDRAAVGDACGPRSPFLRELRTLDLAARGRLETLASRLTTKEARDTVARTAQRMERAASALEVLKDFPAWRRRAVALPGGRRAADAVGMRTEGVLVAADAGAELVPWSVFAESPDTLLGLFKGRLTRAYTLEEERAVQTLLTLNAVTHSLAAAETALDPTRRGLFRPIDAQAMLAAFDVARGWSAEASGDLGPAQEELEREQAAARILAAALSATEESAWTRVVSALEHLATAYSDTLVVLCLSDGSLDPPPPPPPPEPLPVESSDSASSTKTIRSTDD